MTGIAVYLIIGLVLFTPMGFIIGYIQHKNEIKREREMNEAHPFEERNE